MKKPLLLLFFLSALTTWAQGPNNSGTYYQNADGKKAAELKSALFAIISPHTIQTYTYGVWDAIESYDLRADGKIWEIYSGISNFTPKTDRDKGDDVDEGVKYNREHAMPKSWFNEATQDNYTANVYPMYTDLHHLFPTDRTVNTFRSNYPYGEVGNVITKQSEGGFSKFGRCKDDLGYKVSGQNGRVFEPNDEYKGDFARAYFYMATCYGKDINGNHDAVTSKYNGWRLDNGDVGSRYAMQNDNYLEFQRWEYETLIKWHRQDPVSVKEIKRADAVSNFQHNRNPFIDYPYLAEYIWGEKAGQKLDLKHLISSSDPRFVPGVSNGWIDDVPESVEQTSEHNITSRKILKDGKLYIQVGDQLYTVTGQRFSFE